MKTLSVIMAVLLSLCVGMNAWALGTAAPEQEAPALTLEETMRLVFANCTGYEGTAGSSLKEVIAAEYIASAALECAVGDADAEELAQAVSAAWEDLADDRKAEFIFNIEGIARLLDDMQDDFAALGDLFDTAGMLEAMGALAANEDWYDHWTALLEAIRTHCTVQ